MTASRPTVRELLPVLAPAQVLLVQRRGLVSRAIRWVTDSPWSHVALIAESHEAVIVLEATAARGAAAVRIETIFDDPTVSGLLIRDRSDLAPVDRTAICRAAWLLTGRDYDHGVNTDILWRRLTSLRGWLDRSQALNCAEMVAMSYREAWGWLLPRGADPTPGALALTPRLVSRWSWSREIGGIRL